MQTRKFSFLKVSGAAFHLPVNGSRILWIALILFSLLAGWFWLGRPGWPSYRTEDVIRDRPLVASHSLPSGAHTISEWVSGAAAPQLKLNSSFHDFGSIEAGKKVQWVFPVMNEGSAPLVIQRAYTTCECTAASFSASVIPKGKVSLVTVTFDPSLHGYPGTTVRRGVIFETNDPAHPQSELWVQARLK